MPTILDDPFAMTAGFGPAETPPPRAKWAPMEGSPQQEDFWAELLTGSGHVLLEARAGTGKSTSCREGMWRLLALDRRRVIRYACFNKAIADEFQAKCPPGVEVGTMHRFGNLALQSAFGSQLDQFKTYTVLDALEGGPALKRYVRKSIATLVSLAKNHGLRPDDPELSLRLSEFVCHFDVETWGRLPEVLKWARAVLARSAEMTALVDFDDMLWLPAIHGVRFPALDDLFIDEAQDLNPVQHELVGLMARDARVIAVGDPYQSIYAFRGADSDSIPNLVLRLGATVMPLTVSFRCPRRHVALARELVPDFEAAPDAADGTLDHADKARLDRADLGDMILCRANAPNIQACLRLIARGVPATVRGRALGDTLGAVVRKVGEAATMADFVRGLARWRAKELDRLEAKDGTADLMEAVNDKAACLEAIASACDSPAEVPGAIVRLFDDVTDPAERVNFSSVHRAKGLEARAVLYHVIPYSEQRDKLRPPMPWEVQQRRNLRYVALTRSLESLTIVA